MSGHTELLFLGITVLCCSPAFALDELPDVKEAAKGVAPDLLEDLEVLALFEDLESPRDVSPSSAGHKDFRLELEMPWDYAHELFVGPRIGLGSARLSASNLLAGFHQETVLEVTPEIEFSHPFTAFDTGFVNEDTELGVPVSASWSWGSWDFGAEGGVTLTPGDEVSPYLAFVFEGPISSDLSASWEIAARPSDGPEIEEWSCELGIEWSVVKRFNLLAKLEASAASDMENVLASFDVAAVVPVSDALSTFLSVARFEDDPGDGGVWQVYAGCTLTF